MYPQQSPNPSYHNLMHGSPHGSNRFANPPNASPDHGQRKLFPDYRPASPFVERSEAHHTMITKTSWIESARESTANFKLHGSSLPLVWILVEDGVIPPNAIPFGEDKNGSTLFIARALLEGGLHLGKVGHHLQHALISYNGKEYSINDYEILVCASQLRWDLASYESAGCLSQGTVILARQNQQLQLEQSQHGSTAWVTQQGQDDINAQACYSSGYRTQTSHSGIQEVTASTHNSFETSKSIGTTLFVTDIPRYIPNTMPTAPAPAPAPVTMAVAKERLKKKLVNCKTAVLIDDSISMEGSWTLVHEALGGIVDIANKHGSQGIDLHFLHQDDYHKNIKTSQGVQEIFNRILPDGQDTPTAEKLEELINIYLPRLERKFSRHDPIEIIIITDGVATDNDDLPAVIIAAAQRLDMHKIADKMFGIQFVQIGADEEATTALHNLDEHLAQQFHTRNIVNTTPFNPQHGVFDTHYMLKILLGDIYKMIEDGGPAHRELLSPHASVPQRGSSFGSILSPSSR